LLHLTVVGDAEFVLIQELASALDSLGNTNSGCDRFSYDLSINY